ncbi:CAAX prenyl protease 1 [Wickerhamiella sorbophila]|uniref:CAAX prenyl protease n=1 Tax=Wickerhamiella sorbophila TaxID=45607 RepID=A0A2T0FPX5_9ASCO|nr:CAAX prenyl protease 1 [Wickerhamiella sorbophila]PRT57030.1 CAAX prenyl protease 1 [Wickerhamiella sorbophila]
MIDYILKFVQQLAGAVDVPGTDWKKVIGTILGAHFAFETVMNLRQLSVLKRTQRPEVVKTFVDQDTYDKTQAYGRAKLQVSIVQGVYDLAMTYAVYKYGGLPRMWGWAQKAVSWLGWSRFSGPIAQSVAFFAIQTPLTQLIAAPFSLYNTFVLEEKFGFNKMTLGLWITDMVKTLGLSVALGGPIMAALLKIIDYFGDVFFVYATLFVLGLNLVMMVVYPLFIDPIFNKNTPLEEGELRTAINKLAGDLKFPLGEVYVQDSSRRSAHSNAYFTGLPWFKRIVIFDNLIENSSVEEVVAVLAHELGHWKRSHIPRLLTMNLSIVLATFGLFSAFAKNASLYRSLGFAPGTMPIIVGFIVFSDLLKPVEAPINFIQSYITRMYEYEADRFAVDLGYGGKLASALTTMMKKDLATVNADWLYSTYHYSHPILPERLRAIYDADPSAKPKTE